MPVHRTRITNDRLRRNRGVERRKAPSVLDVSALKMKVRDNYQQFHVCYFSFKLLLFSWLLSCSALWLIIMDSNHGIVVALFFTIKKMMLLQVASKLTVRLFFVFILLETYLLRPYRGATLRSRHNDRIHQHTYVALRYVVYIMIAFINIHTWPTLRCQHNDPIPKQSMHKAT